MKKYKRSNKDPLYPVPFKGKDYYREDCHPFFVAWYTCVEALYHDISVYVSNDLGRIHPDGSWSQED